MNNYASRLIAVLALGCLFVTSGCGSQDELTKWEELKKKAVQAELTKADPELQGKIEIQPGGQSNQDYHARKVSFYDDGVTPRVAKAILLHQNYGNAACAVRYEYFDSKGKLKRSKTVFPEEVYGSSCRHVYHEEFFGADGKSVIEERYVRADGSLSAEAKQDKNGTMQGVHFAEDGKTVRWTYSDSPGQYRKAQYRKDGVSLWWTYDHAEKLYRVHYDFSGASVNKKFTREYYSYTVKIDGVPVIACTDRYLRADGSTEYLQVWYAMYDKTDKRTKHVLLELHLYSPDGKPLKTVFRNPVAFADGQSIKLVSEFKADGVILHRYYRSPGSRLKEETWAKEKLLNTVDFDEQDRFDEHLDDIYFQGFDLDLWGTNFDDDHSHDI